MSDMTTQAVPEPSQSGTPTAPETSYLRVIRTRRWRPRRRNILAAGAISYLVLVVLVAIFAPIIWPDVMTQQAGDILEANELPNAAHPLGTDTVGRDVLLRLLVGTQPTMIGVAQGLFFAALLGVPIGIAAGYFRGWLDKVVGWLADIAFSIPGIVIIIVVLAVFRQNMLAAMITFGALAAPGLMRVARAVTLQVREELFVSAAKVAGLGAFYILTRHVLSRIRGALAVQLSLLAAAALLVQSGLAFLGLLVAPPAPSWGGMVAEGTNVLAQNAWLILPSGSMIALTIVAFGLVGDVIQTTTGTRAAATKAPSRQRKPAIASSPPRASEPADDGQPREIAEDALVVVRNLRVAASLPHRVTHLVDSVTLTIGRGETLGLVGESGCGKSVTAAAIMGILPSNLRVDSGSIEFDGIDLVSLDEAALRQIHGKRIGFIGQEPMIGLNPTMKVGAQLAELVRLHHGVRRVEANRRAIELLASVRLPDPEAVARKYPHEMSGGMAQRVSIARALAGDPELLIADEPTTALDVTVQAEILELLREIQKRQGMSILLITHDWGVVANVCDRAVVMYAGEVIETEPIMEIFAAPRHPYTGLLLASDPHRTRGVEMLPTIRGTVPPPGSWPKGCRFSDRCPRVQDDCKDGPIPLIPFDHDSHARCIHPLIGVPQ